MRPQVRHTYQNHHLDSRRWDGFEPRPGDIVVSTSYKAGTTLMQTIVANLQFPDGNLPGPAAAISPWLEFRMQPLQDIQAQLDAQTHRRCIKTHLPLDGLPYYDEVQYLVVGRDPRDVFMSLLNHYGNHTAEFHERLNHLPGRIGAPFPVFDGDVRSFWRNWISRGWFAWESDGYPYWSHLHHAGTWWEFRRQLNIKLVHYSDLLRDLEGQMRDIALYLNFDVPEDRWPHVVDACRFATVKQHPERVVGPRTEMAFKGGAQTFIHRGTNGRWLNVLSDAELTQYRNAMARALPEDCVRWLELGGPYR